MQRRLLIGIATRDRPQGLRSLLASLDGCEPPPATAVECVVVDNDPGGSAADTLTGLDLALAVTYLHEPRVGIPFARNAALDMALELGHDLIAFVDDDEVVEPSWLVELVGALDRYGADVATGPVLRRLPPGTPRWVVTGGFFAPSHRPEGSARATAYTNNVVVRVEALRDRALRFDERFPMLGGDDSWLFSELHARGGRIVWAERAIVSETIPATRATARWLLRRAYRGGFDPTMRRRHANPGPRSLLIELARMGWRTLDSMRLLALSPLRGRAGLVRAGMRLAAAAGTVAALLGIRFEEYRVTDGK